MANNYKKKTIAAAKERVQDLFTALKNLGLSDAEVNDIVRDCKKEILENNKSKS